MENPEMKADILKQSGVGKTSLISRIATGAYTSI
jgi:GTPase SAR1 family protein